MTKIIQRTHNSHMVKKIFQRVYYFGKTKKWELQVHSLMRLNSAYGLENV